MSRPANQSPAAASALRLVRWLVAGEVRPVTLVAILFTAYMMLQAFGVTGWFDSPNLVQVFSSLLIFGLFVGVVFVTDIKESQVGPETRKRVLAGVASCSAIAAIFGAPWEGIALAAILGAVLGYFGMSWAQHL
jgi:hypothetical protein